MAALQPTVDILEGDIIDLQDQIDAITAGEPQSVVATWSNADIKANTPLALVAAPGANKFIFVDDIIVRFNYGGTNAWTSSPSIFLTYGGVAGGSLAVGWTNAFTIYDLVDSTGLVPITPANLVNTALTFTLSAPPTGNAAGDNTVTVKVYYTVVDVF